MGQYSNTIKQLKQFILHGNNMKQKQMQKKGYIPVVAHFAKIIPLRYRIKSKDSIVTLGIIPSKLSIMLLLKLTQLGIIIKNERIDKRKNANGYTRSMFMREGYTLIEMVIVLSILSMIIPIIFSIIYVLLNQQVKIYRLVETKRQGDRIMSFMKEKISREAVDIQNASAVARCATYTGNPETTTDGNDFVFLKDKTATPATFKFFVNSSNLLAQDSTLLPSTSLNDNKVKITNFQIECFKKNTTTPFQSNVLLIGFSYTVQFVDTTPTTAEGTTSLQYQTKISLR
ncbi:hypothetical protein BH09PAT2_BH09PAT2_09460 [soil metagenome]